MTGTKCVGVACDGCISNVTKVKIKVEADPVRQRRAGPVK